MKTQLTKALESAEKEMVKLEKLEVKLAFDDLAFSKSGVLQKKAHLRDLMWHLDKALHSEMMFQTTVEAFK